MILGRIVLFLISFVFVFLSTYLLSSILAKKNTVEGFMYIFILSFAQIILTMECLSLISAINEVGILVFNILFLFGVVFLWHKKGKPLWSFDFKPVFCRIFNSMKLDKSLLILFVGFLTMILSAFFLATVMWIVAEDSQAYHVARAFFWAIQGNLNHFETTEIRNLVLPINSELLYLWPIVFLKKARLMGLFSFSAFILAITSVYNIIRSIGYSTRKTLWVVFILSSFASVLVQVSGLESDIIIASLLTTALFLFWKGTKNCEKTPIMVSAISFAIAFGTKTPTFFSAVGFGILFCIISYKYLGKDAIKHIAKYIGYGAIAFVVFSLYNYVLNFLEFGNFFTSESFSVVSKNEYGIRGFFASLIKHFFLFIDFTGFHWGDYLFEKIYTFRIAVLTTLGINVPDGLYNRPELLANRQLLDPKMGLGILGFLVFVPCFFIALIKPFFDKRTKTRVVGVFAWLFIVSVGVMSALLCFMHYNIRFIMTMVVISAPVLVYSYFRKFNVAKFVIIVFAMFYLCLVSTHLWERPFFRVIDLMFVKHESTPLLESRGSCRKFSRNHSYSMGICYVNDEVRSLNSKNKILFLAHHAEELVSLEEMNMRGYHIDIKSLENMRDFDWSMYNVVIIQTNGQASTVIKNYEKNRKLYRIDENSGLYFANNDNQVPCYYVNTKLEPLNSASAKPYKSICNLTDKFIYSHNLRFVKHYQGSASKTMGYVIFENKKNPIIK